MSLFLFSFLFFFLGLYCQINKIILFIYWELISLNTLRFEISLIIDFYSCLFGITVSLIAGAVFLFSKSYIVQEIFFVRFHLTVLSFIVSIYLLIFRPNLIRILLGWDGLGVTSYLLVIYFHSRKAYNAGLLTALSNRVGDILIIIRLSVILKLGSWNIVFNLYDLNLINLNILIICLTLAAITKRAQIPFSAWLPAAIAAPTPVSALVHSSTLVTAGVYLLFRFHNLLIMRKSLYLLLLVGTLTILLAGLRALIEKDMKKIVALSTLSQLGLIMSRLGVGLKEVCYFHLLIHAFFKALLFISVGQIIHLSRDYQDLRKINLLSTSSQISFSFINIANLRLCGIPFIAGFYSKDLYIELRVLTSINIFVLIFFFLSIGLTVGYTLRFFFLTSWNFPRTLNLFWLKDLNKDLLFRGLLLWFIAIFSGAFLNWLRFPLPGSISLPFELKNLTTTVIIGIVLIRRIFFNFSFFPKFILKNFIFNIWALPMISSSLNVKASLCIRKIFRIWGDLFWVRRIRVINLNLVYLQINLNQSKPLIQSFFFNFQFFFLLSFIIYLFYLCIIK